ncbi:MAG: ATP-binding cassette domain-containing protein [Hamadaea sp.]|uniref:ATP-binding cassette domain-containing protein n=1 Tax=Hamadaea sp. TaxID=2024425 RepID=UPI00179D9328|nr:ATP-binding cassette domain-containing protein [Hamadaea sp.]NUR73603.1 ATP-binding cassette domain-containing protein [Hamadaea sp.]NUT22799.1 ATP-binding cassette domain-containing protein [Hamadaea sp.]
MTAVIEIRGLRKNFRGLRGGGKVALDGFDMTVEAGQVHGFLGPNGSGKTTTLRTLLGLVRADAGQMTVLGRPSSEYAAVAHRVGAIVESPAFFGNFTARKTLSLLAAAGGVEPERVRKVLERVGLRDRENERVKTFSLGMKQRLAVASALLKGPELLILDEPANGLDPGGIHEMRTLLRDLAAEGVTVLVSSHILSEIEQVCDTVTIISRGRRVVAGPVGAVLAAHSKNEHLVRVKQLDRAREVLEGAGLTVSAVDGHLVVGGATDPAVISEALGRAEVWLTELSPVGADLESVFLDLTATRPLPGAYRQVDDTVQVESGQLEVVA